MVALNFQKQFAEDVETGRKRRTIRAPRKDGRQPFRKGVMLQLYTGMRSKFGCRKLIPDTPILRVRPVTITAIDICLDGFFLWHGDAPAYQGGVDPEHYEADFCRADGFDGFPDMMEFFEKTHGLPFDGNLIEW